MSNLNISDFVLELLRNNAVPISTNPINFNSNSKKIPIDMINDEKMIYIYAELPGIPEENIEIDIFNNKLTISADKKLNYNSPEVKEIKSGKFERTICLPICVTNKKTVVASLSNGVLKIEINKLIEEKNAFKLKIDSKLSISDKKKNQISQNNSDINSDININSDL